MWAVARPSRRARSLETESYVWTRGLIRRLMWGFDPKSPSKTERGSVDRVSSH